MEGHKGSMEGPARVHGVSMASSWSAMEEHHGAPWRVAMVRHGESPWRVHGGSMGGPWRVRRAPWCAMEGQ